MASTDYTFIYTFSSGTPATGGELINQATEANTLTEIDANPNDGSVAVGDDFSVTGPGGTTVYELLGLTADGDPIFSTGTIFYVLSNTDYPNTQSGDPGFPILATDTGSLAVCFAAGTLIRTPKGEARVEDLSIGDLILTADGRTIPVKWIGRQTVSTRFGPAERLMPVRFAAGSLGNGLPHEPLTVTADHGMLVEGVICHAGALVNGTTITQVPLAEMGASFTVYHIESEEHEIILANGAPAETLIDNVSRRVFDNFAEFEELYGDVPEMEELPYPRAMSARQVPNVIKAKLAVEAAA
jgi:hypothetical protein